jgi:kynurenine--oxoglutarate transaminase/cysteine-S-conjugate beta-lyase/glutamine--phenylpyruvate transaminase
VAIINKLKYTHNGPLAKFVQLFIVIFQETVAAGLDYELSVFGDPEKCYLQSLALEMLPKRDMLAKVLTEVGITPTIPEGGYFMMADISKLG